MNTQQQALLDVAKTSLGSLPESGQIEAFNHLDSKARAKINSAALANMSAEERRAILSAYPEVPAATSTSQAAALQLTQNLAAFVATYKIRAIEGKPSQVAQTIPTDKTYADCLREGQALSIALHAAFPEKYKADQAIWPASLEPILADPALQAKGTGRETITDGCVSGTNGEGMTRAGATRKLASQGLKHENDLVLVAAHTGRYLVDATSIFQGQAVRAVGGLFYFFADGLLALLFNPEDSRDNVSSSARRSS